MSIDVDIARLGETLADFDLAYLLTASGEGVIKINGVRALVRDGLLVVPMRGMQARLNIAEVPTVTVLCPPRTPDGYSLIVDGRATATEDEVLITPTRGILHRPALPAVEGRNPDGSCVQDCDPV